MGRLDDLKDEVAKAVAIVSKEKRDRPSFFLSDAASKCDLSLSLIEVGLGALEASGHLTSLGANYRLSAKFIEDYGSYIFSDIVAVPASDRIVTLNHNQSDYQQAVEALDRVLEEFRKDHGPDNELGPQKEARLKVLEGGRKALEDKEISVENGQNWIVAPLKWIAEKYADGTLKALATEALKWVLSLFGAGN